MSTAQVPPTPENVAETLTDSDNDFHDGNGWHQSLTATGNVVSIEVEPLDADGDPVDTVHFRAVVVEGAEAPIVMEWPAELGLSWPDGGDLLALEGYGVIRMYPRGVDEWDMTPAEARELAAQLAAMASASEAAFPVQDVADAASGRSCACSEFGQCPACGGPSAGDVRLVDGPNGGC